MGRPRALGAFAVVLLCALGVPALAYGAPALRSLRYHGLPIRIPRSWPVIDLSRDPHACVRFDRHALYLGSPGAEENCPARAVGRTEALLIQPVARTGGRTVLAPGLEPEGNTTTFVIPSAGVEVTATWLRQPRLVAQALGRDALPSSRPSIPAPAASGSPSVRESTARARRGPIYTGFGFDRCAAPSLSQMKAWSASPYRAVGIYVGGANASCLQPNLTASWVRHVTTAGWHAVPLYVGLQAPKNGCGCQAMSKKTTQAYAEGEAAADDAVSKAQSLGMPAGGAIYDDVEGYTRSTTNTRAVLSFLSGWTAGLHADGYLSGVYSSADSGIHDLVSRYGSSYLEPNDIWIADWNGQQTTSDPQVPGHDWANHQRLHQYRAGSKETYNKVTMDVDDNYLNGATASGLDGYSLLTSDGGVHVYGSAVAHGSDLGKLGSGVTAVSLATDLATHGYWILKSNGGIDNFDAPAHGSLNGKLGSLKAVALAAPRAGGYLALTSDGGVHPFGGAHWYGSDAGKLPTGITAVAFAIDPRTGGYWILKSDGGVDNFHAPWAGSLKHKLGASLPMAIAGPPKAGYLILTSNGGVHKFGGAASYGSDAGKLPAGVSAVALATSPTLAGYRIFRSDGGVDGFDATWSGSLLGKLPTGVSAVAIGIGG